MRSPALAERFALAVRTDGTAVAMYSDGFPFEVLGRITAMPRASRVEWDPEVSEWVARDAETHVVIAHDRSRDVVLRREHAYYVDRLIQGSTR